MGDGTHTVGQALRTTALEHGMTTFSLALADSHAEVDLEAPAHLLDGDTIILEDAFVPSDPSEGKWNINLRLMITEQRFLVDGASYVSFR